MSSLQSDLLPDYSVFPRLTQSQRRQAAQQLLVMQGDGPLASEPRLAEIRRFYDREARLLDAERFDDWYALLADDLFYWMPLQENRFRRDKRRPLDPASMALFDDCKGDIAVRIARFGSQLVWSEDPPTRHVHLVSNVEAFKSTVPDEFEVHSIFVQYRNRSEHDATTLYGRRRDLLRWTGADYQIARRLILMPQSVLLTKNLTAFF